MLLHLHKEKRTCLFRVFSFFFFCFSLFSSFFLCRFFLYFPLSFFCCFSFFSLSFVVSFSNFFFFFISIVFHRSYFFQTNSQPTKKPLIEKTSLSGFIRLDHLILDNYVLWQICSFLCPWDLIYFGSTCKVLKSVCDDRNKTSCVMRGEETKKKNKKEKKSLKTEPEAITRKKLLLLLFFFLFLFLFNFFSFFFFFSSFPFLFFFFRFFLFLIFSRWINPTRVLYQIEKTEWKLIPTGKNFVPLLF